MGSDSRRKTNSGGITVTLSRGLLIRLGVLAAISVSVMFLYVTFFQHDSPSELLKSNRERLSLPSGEKFDFGASLFDNSHGGDNSASKLDDDEEKEDMNNEDDGEEEEGDEEGKDDDVIVHQKRELGQTEEAKSTAYWEDLLKKENLVPIGAVYSKCESPRLQIGAVVLLEDTVNGGIMARTYINITLDKNVDGGQMNIDSKFNGRSLYDNYWELCEVEDDLPDEEKTFTCPLSPGSYTRVKDKNIPSFLPKGRYQSKIWAHDQDGEMLGCGFSDFTI